MVTASHDPSAEPRYRAGGAGGGLVTVDRSMVAGRHCETGDVGSNGPRLVVRRETYDDLTLRDLPWD